MKLLSKIILLLLSVNLNAQPLPFFATLSDIDSIFVVEMDAQSNGVCLCKASELNAENIKYDYDNDSIKTIVNGELVNLNKTTSNPLGGAFNIGPDMAFMYHFLNHYKTHPSFKPPVILSKTAASSTCLTQDAGLDWNVNSTGELYDSTIEKTLTGIDLIKQMFPAVAVGVKVQTFIQGECDALKSADSADYKNALDSLNNGIDARLRSEMTHIVVRLPYGVTNATDVNKIRAAQTAHCEEYERSFLVSSDTISKQVDNVHYTTNGGMYLGVMMFDAFINQSNNLPGE